MGFVDRVDQSVAKYWISIQIKICLWFPFTLMVGVVLQKRWVYRNNKNEGSESLPILVFVGDAVSVIFMKYSKEARSSSSHVGI